MASQVDEREVACRDFVALVTDYLEGALSPDVRALVEVHLAGCPDCELYLDEMRRVRSALGHVAVESLSEATRDGLLAAFRGYRAG